MAIIHSLKISNFRGIKSFEQIFEDHDFVCIVGRGDTGKTTILDAISYVLSPNWNITFYDTDFNNCDIDTPIEIEISISDVPSRLLQLDKFGSYIRFLNLSTKVIQDDYIDDAIPILTIHLKVERDLEPIWYVSSCKGETKEIKSNDRSKLNVFLVSDFINQHFSWNKGTPLYSLLKQADGTTENTSIVIDALRNAKEKVNDADFTHLDPVIDIIKTIAASLGIDIANTLTSIDLKDLSIKDGRICLHDENIPFRLKGKGSKRLISIGIQIALAKLGGIILIDELEQGLEPDRVKHLIRTLYNNNKKNKTQIFITTHSQNVVEELECDNLFFLNNDSGVLTGNFIPSEDKYQSLIRFCPSAIYAKKIIVCEGKTEIGICRALDQYRINTGSSSFTTNNVVYVDGSGSSFTDRALRLKKLELEVCILSDSDRDETLNPTKDELLAAGIIIIDWEAGKSIERQIFDDLPWNGIVNLVDYRIKDKKGNIKSVIDSINEFSVIPLTPNWKETPTDEIRDSIYQACTKKVPKPDEDKSWFKRIDHGEELGNIIFDYFEEMKGKRLHIKLQELSNWIG
ncbi:MAG: AAA family ATPase [Paludibacter sp.]|nr:AAA family ATPase [Paludibacter sp.]